MTQPVNRPHSEFSDHDVCLMAEALLRRHGPAAADVASHFAQEHEEIRDFPRAAAWRRVETWLRG
ncbi:MAG: hypothetical protein AB7U38_11555 [Hyphomicrobiales bacterium]